MKRAVRKLIGWLDERRALAELFAGQPPNERSELAAAITRWKTAKEAVDRREAYNGRTPAIADLPASLVSHSAEFFQRGEVQSLLGRRDWRLGVVDLGHIIAFQLALAEEVGAARIAKASQDDWPSLFEVCLPGPLPTDQLDVFSERFDSATSAFTVSSLNPNLRVLRPGVSENAFDVRQIAPGVYEPNDYASTDRAAHSRNFGFVVGVRSSLVRVVDYKGRLYLSDGYHRCYGLMRRGIRRVPCVVEKVATFEATGMNQGGALGPEVLGGERPPFVTDFLDDTLAATVEEDALIKVIRVMAQEFTVRARDSIGAPDV